MSNMPSLIQESIPNLLYHPLRKMRNFVRHLPYRRGKDRFCPICEKYSARFAAFGSHARSDAQCLRCGSLERERFVWLYFKKETTLFDGKKKRMLHLAPEPAIEVRLKESLGKSYLTADLSGTRVMVTMDITNIHFPDNHFDVIFCSHVLEHVPDDAKAIRELARVLNPAGWAILMVPIKVDRTFEDLSITGPRERKRIFGQEDHVRIYGKDFVNRVEKNGFEVSIVGPADFLAPEEIQRMGITSFAGEIFLCYKKSTVAK